mmetsp:Transcript_13862/g.58295  ORF Transcript_13862/g.58295 Transcript_13862/m.58295 type:complete len:272 (+) Transcript_13862:1082-1897(+)
MTRDGVITSTLSTVSALSWYSHAHPCALTSSARVSHCCSMGPSSTCSSGRRLCATPRACALAFCHRRTICSATRASTSGARRENTGARDATSATPSATFVAAAPSSAPTSLGDAETEETPSAVYGAERVSAPKPYATSAAPATTAPPNATLAAAGFWRSRRATRALRALREALTEAPTAPSALRPGTSPAPPSASPSRSAPAAAERAAASNAASVLARAGAASRRSQKRCTSGSSNHCVTVGTRSTRALSRKEGNATSAIQRSASAIKPSV